MKIHNYEVPDSVIDAALAAMRGRFTAADITKAVINAGAPEVVGSRYSYGMEYCAYRISDRLLQKQRKAGRIWYADGFWQLSNNPIRENKE